MIELMGMKCLEQYSVNIWRMAGAIINSSATSVLNVTSSSLTLILTLTLVGFYQATKIGVMHSLNNVFALYLQNEGESCK